MSKAKWEKTGIEKELFPMKWGLIGECFLLLGQYLNQEQEFIL